jgi:hypothetical protein
LPKWSISQTATNVSVDVVPNDSTGMSRKGATVIGGINCSLIPKSGKATYRLDWFYNGSASRSQKGLEISVIAVIDVEAPRGYSLSMQQTPANLAIRKAKAPTQSKKIACEVIEWVQQMLDVTLKPVTPKNLIFTSMPA